MSAHRDDLIREFTAPQFAHDIERWNILHHLCVAFEPERADISVPDLCAEHFCIPGADSDSGEFGEGIVVTHGPGMRVVVYIGGEGPDHDTDRTIFCSLRGTIASIGARLSIGPERLHECGIHRVIEKDDAPLDAVAPKPFEFCEVMHLHQRPFHPFLRRAHGITEGHDTQGLALAARQGDMGLFFGTAHPAGHHAGLQENGVRPGLPEHAGRFNDRLLRSRGTGKSGSHLLAQYP